MAPLPAKPLVQLGPLSSAALSHMSKRKIILHSLRAFVNRLRRMKPIPFVAVYIPACGGLITP